MSRIHVSELARNGPEWIHSACSDYCRPFEHASSEGVVLQNHRHHDLVAVLIVLKE